MFSTLTVALAAAAVAQAASSNPYIPSGISATCETYLENLNADTDLAPCTSALITATSAYGPGGSDSTGASKATITSALDNICSSSSASCPQSLLTGKLASFYTACGPELTGASPNAQCKLMYDTFYVLSPFLSTVCSKDDSGDYCALSSTAGGAAVSDLVSRAAGSIARRDSNNTVTAYMPNAGEINLKNILFLFLNGSLPKDTLCTTCTRNVLTSFVTFETNTNYAPGLKQSTLIAGQPDLYSGVQNTCGADFLTSAVQAAGGLGQTTGTSAAVSVRAASGVLATLAGALGVVAAVML